MLNTNKINFCEYTGEYVTAHQGNPRSRTGYQPIAGEPVLVFPTGLLGLDTLFEFAFTSDGELWLIGAEDAAEAFDVIEPPAAMADLIE